jgi:membrane protein implicated in regulation of membrane protease activity
MSATHRLPDPQLERHGKAFLSPALGFLAIAAMLLVPGILLVVLGSSWVSTLGIVLIAISLPFDTVGIAALGSAAVARWAARHKPFA